MKGTGILCASQFSTNICTGMEQASSSSNIHLGATPAIDRHNPIIRDSRRTNFNPTSNTSTSFSNSPSPPTTPKPHKNTSTKNSFSKPTSRENANKKRLNDQTSKRRNNAKTFDIIRKSSSCVIKPNKLVSTPPGSSRYLLSDNGFYDPLTDTDSTLELAPVENKENLALANDHQSSSSSNDNSLFPGTLDKSSSSSHCTSDKSLSSSRSNPDQVVVLRVSLHCKGCAGKVKKHISKMKGVTSFDIDFAAKQVTVVGEVTPLEVLASISKVKNAQLWTPEKSKSSSQVTTNSWNKQIMKAWEGYEAVKPYNLAELAANGVGDETRVFMS